MSHGWLGRRRPALVFRLVSILLLSGFASAQGGATERLLSLLRSSNPGRDHQEFLARVVEAGPAALPALEGLLTPGPDARNRQHVLASILLIGGSRAASVIEREYAGGDRTLKPALAAVLATADSPRSRASLVRMLAEGAGDEATFQAAALALGLLRAPEGLSVLQSFSPTPHSAEAEIVELALQWITGAESAVDIRNGGDRDRVLAAVLRNGIPGVPPIGPVFDDATGKIWQYGASGWTFGPTQAADPVALGPVAYSVISSDGMRAAVSVEFRCGPDCEGGAYDFVLRKASGQWKVQSILKGDGHVFIR
jgi:hypothetical protein